MTSLLSAFVLILMDQVVVGDQPGATLKNPKPRSAASRSRHVALEKGAADSLASAA